MPPRTFTVFTTRGTTQFLRRNTQVVLTVTPSGGFGQQGWTALAWKSWMFQAHGQQSSSAQSDSKCKIDIARLNKQSVAGCGIRAGIGTDHYLTLSEEGRWESNRLWNTSGKIIVINESAQMQQFVLGTSSKHADFEPLILLKDLHPHEAIMFARPHIIQIYAVESGPHWDATSILDSNSSPVTMLLPPTVISDLKDDVSWHLYTGDDGRPILEDVSPRPNPSYPPIALPPILQSPAFVGDALLPEPSYPTPPSPPTSVGSPGFMEYLLTPPMTPLPEPFDISSDLGSPGFMLSPLLLPQDFNMHRFDDDTTIHSLLH